MIKVVSKGDYTLYEDQQKRKILVLDGAKLLLWTGNELQLVVDTSSVRKETLSLGKYRLYKVENESDLTNNYYLELYVGKKRWKGYLLPSNILKMRKPTIPITASDKLISVCNCQCSNCTETSC